MSVVRKNKPMWGVTLSDGIEIFGAVILYGIFVSKQSAVKLADDLTDDVCRFSVIRVPVDEAMTEQVRPT